MTTTIKKAASNLRKAADSHPSHKHVIAPTMEVGEMFCQGDIGILRIAKLPRGAKECAWPENGQVAPGNTKGSRHCVRECNGKFHRFDGDTLSDLCFDAAESWTIEHPEHGHVTCQPGLYQFIHQQNEARQRVLD